MNPPSLVVLEESRRKTEKEARLVILLKSVAETANSTPTVEEALKQILVEACTFMGWPIGHALMLNNEEQRIYSTKVWFINTEKRFQRFQKESESVALKIGEGLPGRAWEKREPVWIHDLKNAKNFSRRASVVETGCVSGFAFPVIVNDQISYILEFFSEWHLTESREISGIMESIGGQLSVVIERERVKDELSQRLDEKLTLEGRLNKYIVEIKRAHEAVIQADMAKSEFLANMSHELRTPLNAILGMGRLLIESSLKGEQRELADATLQSSTNLLKIVNDILDLSKIEAGGVELERIGFDIVRVFDFVVNTLKHSAKEKGLDISVHYNKSGFPYVIGDSLRLSRVLMNLLSNAIKYTNEGHIDFNATFTKVDDRHIEIQCNISDTGIGIPKEKLDKIFDKFVQADTSITRKYGGTGLGLTITKQLVELMGGGFN